MYKNVIGIAFAKVLVIRPLTNLAKLFLFCTILGYIITDDAKGQS